MTATVIAIFVLVGLSLALPVVVVGFRIAHERANFTPTVHRTLPGAHAARDFDSSLGERFGPVAAYAEINIPRARPVGEFIAESNVDLWGDDPPRRSAL